MTIDYMDINLHVNQPGLDLHADKYIIDKHVLVVHDFGRNC